VVTSSATALQNGDKVVGQATTQGKSNG
jgi:hypothetical protein